MNSSSRKEQGKDVDSRAQVKQALGQGANIQAIGDLSKEDRSQALARELAAVEGVGEDLAVTLAHNWQKLVVILLGALVLVFLYHSYQGVLRDRQFEDAERFGNLQQMYSALVMPNVAEGDRKSAELGISDSIASIKDLGDSAYDSIAKLYDAASKLAQREYEGAQWSLEKNFGISADMTLPVADPGEQLRAEQMTKELAVLLYARVKLEALWPTPEPAKTEAVPDESAPDSSGDDSGSNDSGSNAAQQASVGQASEAAFDEQGEAEGDQVLQADSPVDQGDEQQQQPETVQVAEQSAPGVVEVESDVVAVDEQAAVETDSVPDLRDIPAEKLAPVRRLLEELARKGRFTNLESLILLSRLPSSVISRAELTAIAKEVALLKPEFADSIKRNLPQLDLDDTSNLS